MTEPAEQTREYLFSLELVIMPRRRSGKKIDFLHWTYSFASITGLSAGGAIAGTLAAALHLPETLMRTRGEITVNIDGSLAPGISARIGVGIIVVPEGTGTTNLWAPITDGDAPWLWVGYYTLGYEEPVVDVIGSPIFSSVRDKVDSKAMRILRNSELQIVAENFTLQGALTANVSFQGRFLSGK